MSSPDHHDASPSPDYSGPDGSDHGDLDMTAEQKPGPRSGDHSPETKPNGTAKSNAKDPTRPRRKKARRACFACQRAHLTCGDERPCARCIKRGLQDHCMDGVRKKAKYLHDAPDGALMPGVGGHYPHMNGGRPAPVPTHSQESIPQQPGYFAQAPSTAYYPPNSTPGQPMPVQDPAYGNPQAPISPQYGQNPQAALSAAPAPVSQGAPPQMTQFGGGPLFDPSDPALFNFDIAGLNFGNHYGALELSMLGHISSAAIDTPANDTPLNQTAHGYNGPMNSAAYNDQNGLPAPVAFGQEGLPSAEWQHPHSRHGSLQVHTPNNTPVTVDRHDSVNNPMAYAIGQGGPSSLSSASPASMDFNSGYDNENPMSAATFFANANQAQSRGSPTTHRPQQQQENRPQGGPLYPTHPNAGRKRQSKLIYEKVKKPYDYPSAHHRLLLACQKRFSNKSKESVRNSLGRFRPSLLINASHLDTDDLIHAEKNLQRSLIAMSESFAELGTPSLIVRRTGEVVGMNKEFEILTGWKREVLLGYDTNLNANFGTSQQRSGDSGVSTQNNTTPILPGQEPESGHLPVNIVELMDEPGAVQYLSDFADFATGDVLARGHRRVNFLRYQTQEDIAREADRSRGANGHHTKHEPLVKHEDGTIHRGEAMRSLGSRNGLIDCMMMWHIKRDNFDMPMLVAFQIMPVLSTTQ